MTSFLEWYVIYLNWQYFLRHGKDFEPYKPKELKKKEG